MADQLFWCGLLLGLSAEHESTAAAQCRRRRVARRLLRLLVVECPTVERRAAAEWDRSSRDKSKGRRNVVSYGTSTSGTRRSVVGVDSTAADEDGYRQHDSSCSQRPSAVPSDGNM